MTLGKSLCLSEPQFPLLQVAGIIPGPRLLLGGSNKMKWVSFSVHNGKCPVTPVNAHSPDHVLGAILAPT